MSHLPAFQGLRNYRPQLSHTVYGTVKSTDRAGISARRANRLKRHVAMSVPLQPELRDEIKNFLGDDYMAGRYGRKRKVTSKKYKKKGIVRKYIPRTLTPQTKLIKVRATQYLPHGTMTNGALQMTPIQLNSCDDPFGASGAGQPLGYDQWKSLYKKAFVVGSRLKVTYHNKGTVALVCGITPMPFSQGSTALTGADAYEYYKEYRGTKSRLLSPDVDHGVLVSKVGVKKFYSIKDLRDNDEYEINLINETPPSKLGWFHVWTQPVDQTTTGQAADIVADVEYIILLTDPIIPSRSIET